MAARRNQPLQERLEHEPVAARAWERRRRLYGVLAVGVPTLAAAGGIVLVADGGGGSSGSGGSAEPAFGTHYGLEARREAAGVPTMADAQSVGAAHFHSRLEVRVNGRKVEIPVNIGIDPAKSPNDMAGLHTHDPSGIVHNEAGTSAKLGQFFAVWGVPFSDRQIGSYRATRSKRVRMWVDGKPSRAFGGLQLRDGQQIVVAYGTEAQTPL